MQPPEDQAPKPGSAQYYGQVSPADPLAGKDSSQFDFIMNQQPKPKDPLASFSNLSPIKIVAGVLILLILVLILGSIFGGGDPNSKRVVDLMAQTQEITRVTEAIQQDIKDDNTLALTATAESTLTSQQTQFGLYLADTKSKYNKKLLAARQDSATDSQMQTATQNNQLESAYAAYLKTSLENYRNSLAGVFKKTVSKTLKNLIDDAYTSVQTLLKSPQLEQT